MLDPVTPSRSLDTHARLAPARGRSPVTDHKPDLLLIERARAGDEAAIEALIRRYARRLFRVARSVIPDDERADAHRAGGLPRRVRRISPATSRPASSPPG